METEATATVQSIFLRFQGSQGEQREVSVSPFRIGRRDDNELKISRPDVSGVHAELRLAQGRWWLHDCRSTNGTFLNGVRIEEPVALSVGDMVHLGGLGLRIVSSAEASQKSRSTQAVANPSQVVQAALDLFRIVQDGGARPYFQPVVDLKTGSAVGFEALGRAESEAGVKPSTLFRLAEQNGVPAQLSRSFRVAAKGCLSCGHCWRDAKRGHFFFNLHPSEILTPQFPLLLDEFARVRDYRIVIEIPESLVANRREMDVWIGEIRSRGLLVAYDDFGAGQSRIDDLIQAPPDFLKLDISLITGLGSGGVKDDLVRAIVNACHRLGVRTIAEGIERVGERKASVALGIDLGQGFLLGVPDAPFRVFNEDRRTLPGSCPYTTGIDVVAARL